MLQRRAVCCIKLSMKRHTISSLDPIAGKEEHFKDLENDLESIS